MALRLILVGLVASLALDLPHVSSRSTDRSPVVVSTPCVPNDGPTNLVAFDRFLPHSAIALYRVEKPESTTAKVETVKPADPIVVVAPEPVTAPVATIPAPAESELTWFGPIPVVAAPPIDAIVVTAPMPLPPFFDEVISPEDAPAPALVVAERPTTVEDVDAGFRHVVSTMASAFAADLPQPASTPKALLANAEAVPAPAVPAEEVVEDLSALYPGIAFALNREAEGLRPIPLPVVEVAKLDEAKVEVAKVDDAPEATVTEPANEPAPVSVVEPSTSTTSESDRAERLANAFKLTGQAVNAWAGLLSQRPSVSAMQR